MYIYFPILLKFSGNKIISVNVLYYLFSHLKYQKKDYFYNYLNYQSITNFILYNIFCIIIPFYHAAFFPLQRMESLSILHVSVIEKTPINTYTAKSMQVLIKYVKIHFVQKDIRKVGMGWQRLN